MALSKIVPFNISSEFRKNIPNRSSGPKFESFFSDYFFMYLGMPLRNPVRTVYFKIGISIPGQSAA